MWHIHHQYSTFFISTLGLAFWKANSRKVFAVPVPIKKDRSVLVDDDSLDSDDYENAAAVDVKSGNNVRSDI